MGGKRTPPGTTHIPLVLITSTPGDLFSQWWSSLKILCTSVSFHLIYFKCLQLKQLKDRNNFRPSNINPVYTQSVYRPTQSHPTHHIIMPPVWRLSNNAQGSLWHHLTHQVHHSLTPWEWWQLPVEPLIKTNYDKVETSQFS